MLLSNRSSAYAHLGQWNLALDDADACVELRPSWPRGHACRGAALEGMDKLKEALAAFQMAQQLSPSNQELGEIVSDIEQSLSGSKSIPAPDLTDAGSTNGSSMLGAASFVSVSERTDQVAGVGMHIKQDPNSSPPRIIILNIAEWSPLQGHVLSGDTLDAIDSIPCSSMSFEKASAMVVGRPGESITLQFSRSGKPTPWRVTLPRILPRQKRRVAAHRPANAAPVLTKMLDAAGQSPVLISESKEAVRLVLTCDEVWNERYDEQQAEMDYRRLVTEDVAFSAQIPAARLNVHKIEACASGIKSYLVIHPSPSAGSGIAGIDVLTGRDVALDLIVQSTNPGSRLRTRRPSLVKVAFEGGDPSMQTTFQKTEQASQAQKESDLIRNFMTELETLSFFIQANHDENLLYQCSRVGDKIKPPDVLKPFEAADRLKRAYVKTQEELQALKSNQHASSAELDALKQERNSLAEENDKLRNELQMVRENMREKYESERHELLGRYEAEKREIRAYMIQQDQKLTQAQHAYNHQSDCIDQLQVYIHKTRLPQGRSIQLSSYVVPESELHVRSPSFDWQLMFEDLEHVFAEDIQRAKGQDILTPPTLPACPPAQWDKDEFLSRLQRHFTDIVGERLNQHRQPVSSEKEEQIGSEKSSASAIPPAHQDEGQQPSESGEGAGAQYDERELPAGWAREEHDGQKVFVDHRHRRFSFVHPADLDSNQGLDADYSPIQNSRPGIAPVPSSSISENRQ